MGQAAAEKIAAEVAPYRDATAENPYLEQSPDDRPKSELGKHHRKAALREGRCVAVWAIDPKAAAPPGAEHFDWYDGKQPRAGYVGWYENAERECVGFLAADGTVKPWGEGAAPAPHEQPATEAGEEPDAPRRVKRKAAKRKASKKAAASAGDDA